MAKKLDPRLIEILTAYGEDANEALWDCHGTWVAYHKAIERIAAKAGVFFDKPEMIVNDPASKTVVICVTGKITKDGQPVKWEWSFGEVSPANNKNAYPYAMAEKRAKDRVVLKLVGLHGHVYSEEESDDFKRPEAANSEPPKRQVGWSKDGTTRTAHSLKKEKVWEEFQMELLECETPSMVTKLALAWSKKVEDDSWPESWKELLREEMQKRMTFLKSKPAPDDDTFPGDRPSGRFVSTLEAG